MVETLPVRLFIAAVLLPAVVVVYGFPTTLTLERAIPESHMLELCQLRARDRVRHGRLLQSLGGVVNFPVSGTFDPFLVG